MFYTLASDDVSSGYVELQLVACNNGGTGVKTLFAIPSIPLYAAVRNLGQP